LGQIEQQLNPLKQDSAVLQLQFQLLLNSTIVFTPAPEAFKPARAIIADTAAIKQHPALMLSAQQLQTADAAVALEKSKLLPDLSIGYNNTSIRGTGADNVFYKGSTRFNSVQIGVGVPIFAGSQKARIKSAKLNKQVAEGNYAADVQNINAAYNEAILQQEKYAKAVKYFEDQALKNAALITTAANQQLAAGNINYLEWVQLINQATAVKSEYINTINSLVEATIQVNYFNSK